MKNSSFFLQKIHFGETEAKSAAEAIFRLLCRLKRYGFLERKGKTIYYINIKRIHHETGSRKVAQKTADRKENNA